jgi:hypothetical protein
LIVVFEKRASCFVIPSAYSCAASSSTNIEIGFDHPSIFPRSFDHDPPSLAARDPRRPADAGLFVAWRREEVRVCIMLGEQPNGFVYRARGGYRIVYRLATPVLILDDEDATAWRRTYQAGLRHLERRYRIVGDERRDGRTMLFRLPHATRNADGKPESLQVIGDAEDIGFWSPMLSADDHAVDKHAEPAIESERAPLTRGASRLTDPEHRALAIETVAAHFPWLGLQLRHDFALALGGVLQRESKLDENEARAFALEAVSKAGSQNPTARAQDVVDSYRTIAAGHAATGIPTLREIVGDDDVDGLIEVLSDIRVEQRRAVEGLIEHVSARTKWEACKQPSATCTNTVTASRAICSAPSRSMVRRAITSNGSAA